MDRRDPAWGSASADFAFVLSSQATAGIKAVSFNASYLEAGARKEATFTAYVKW